MNFISSTTSYTVGYRTGICLHVVLTIPCFWIVFLLIEKCQVFYKMYRPPSPPSSDISYTVKPEFPKYLLQISLKPRPPDSVLKLDSLVPRDIKIHPCNVKMWNAAPVTRKIQILRPNSPLSTLHATSGSQNQKSQKEETIAKNTHTKKSQILH